MPIEELQRLALMLGRSLWVRWFAFLNYPFEPQLMGLSLIESVNGQMESFKGGERLQEDLAARGFTWNDDLQMWTITRRILEVWGVPLTFGSLFAGIGGMDLGLERAGMKCKWQVEIDPFCQRVLQKHWPEVPKYGDIRTVTGGDLGWVDLLAGGFPCQDLSVAGRMAGIDGERSGLWSEFARLIGEIRPRYVLIENVSGLLANEPMRRVLGDLSALGYDAEWESLPAGAFGAPFEGDRVWTVAAPCGARLPRFVAEGPSLRRAAGQASTKFGHRVISCAGSWQDFGDLRMGDGFHDRMDRPRIKALGNAVVPQVAEWIGRRIREAAQA